MTKVNGIVFAQAQDNSKAVVADRYVPHALYTQNKAIVESLGGSIVKGVGEFRAEFKSARKAKEFISEAIKEMSKREYNAARKVKESKKSVEKPKTSTKGNKKSTQEFIVLTDAEGNEFTVPKSALAQVSTGKKQGKGNAVPSKAQTQVKKPQTQAKGNAPALTDEGKKALEVMKMSILNRAASAYSIAHGATATTFARLGKSEKVLKEFMPAAKAGLLRSSKWAKAVKEHGLTEAMLG